jgi:uncharacterized phage-like protein YoqJ
MTEIAWTGHRPEVFQDPAAARRVVDDRARALREEFADLTFVCGGQRGVDQWAAEAGIILGFPVRIVLPVPFAEFTRDWSEADRAALDALLASVAHVEVVDPAAQHPRLAYDLRNEAVVRTTSRLVVIWTGVGRGGTFYTRCAAVAQGVAVDEALLASAALFDVGSRGL